MNNAKGIAVSDIDSVKYNKVGVLLEITPQVRIGQTMTPLFINRINATEQLNREGRIERILISGKENGLDGINEPECIRDSLVARGVPVSDIIIDGKGFSTISSIVNANKVYGLKSFTIISQKYHNERAIYIAGHLSLDVENIRAYNADNPNSKRALITYVREPFARVKKFFDLTNQ